MSATILHLPTRCPPSTSHRDIKGLLMGAAIQVFCARRAEEVTLEEIAGSAGVTCAEARALFPDISELREAVIRELAGWANGLGPGFP